MPACGYRPENVTDDDLETADEYFGGGASTEVWRASAEAWTVREPEAEPYSTLAGGEGGIRTHGTVTRTLDFESSPFDHSGTSPRSGVVYRLVRWLARSSRRAAVFSQIPATTRVSADRPCTVPVLAMPAVTDFRRRLS